MIAALATVIAPPAIAGGVWRQFVSTHIFVALVIWVVYEVAVAAVGFFAVIARDVSSRWQQRIAESLDRALRLRFSGFEARYREFLLAGLRFVDLKGLATIGPFTPELDEVFVDVSLIPRSPHLIQPGVLSDLAGPGRRALSQFIGRRQAAVLAVVGGPGSGKTTLLRHTARHACLQAGSLGKKDRSIPVILYLRDHSAEIVANSSVPLVDLVRNSLGTLAQAEPQGWFERQLRTGRCLVLLDGFDEVARQSDRTLVAEWVARQVQLYPGNDFVISSRPHGYQSAPVAGAEVAQVCGFTSVQTERFIRGWYQAIERHSTGAEGPDIEERARVEADDLLRRLEQAPALYELTVNPLLLTMIANVHRYRGALPGNRADLYSEICQVMLWRRQDAKNLASQMNGDKKEAVLRALAYSMMDGRVSDLSRDDLIAVIKPVLRRQSRRVTAVDFLADVATSGLLIERETEQYAFAHHTFQEYLAAAHIRDNGLVDVLAKAVRDPWWRETTLLYAAHADADPIITACLAANNIAALALAFECVDQDSPFDPALHEQLDAMLDSAYHTDGDPARRRLMAGILLTRHLREQVRVPTGRLCAKPITRGIYDLFLADTGAPGPDAKHSDGPAEEAVTGVRGSDAAEFARWANSITGGTNTYRLPTSDALTHQEERKAQATPPTGPKMTCTWADESTQGSGEEPILWLPGGTADPRGFNRDLLTSAAKDDIIRIIPPAALKLLGTGLTMTSKMIRRITPPDQEFDPDLAIARLPGFGGILSNANRTVTEFADTLDEATKTPPQFTSHFSADFSLALCVALIRMLGRAQQKAQSVRHNLDPQISGADIRGLQRSLERAHTLAAGLASQLAESRTTFDQVNESAPHRVPESLLDSITSASGEASDANSLPQELAEKMALRAGTDDPEWDIRVDPDKLASDLGESLSRFPHWAKEVDQSLSSHWLRMAAERLRVESREIFSRRTAITPQASSSVRLTSLLLAGELAEVIRPLDQPYSESVTYRPKTRAALTFRDVAAGITWMERRSNGTDQATETIMLAIE